MKILFVFTNISDVHHVCYPYGFSSIIATTKEAGYDCQVVALTRESEYEAVVDKVVTQNIDVVAFSSVSTQFRYVVQLSKLIRESGVSNCHIVCGGIHSTLFPECLREAPWLDGVFIGEAEFSFLEFIRKVEKKSDYHDVAGFAYISKKGELVKNKVNKPVTHLEKLPYPDKTLFGYPDEVNLRGVAEFFFSRGCPFKCTYCCNHALANIYGGYSVRTRCPESSIREIEETLEIYPQVKRVRFFDDTFGLDKKWQKDFLELYKERIAMPFECLLNPHVVKRSFVKNLAEAGCNLVRVGVEAGNTHIRNDLMKRNLSDQQIVQAFELLHEYGISTISYNIIGVPEETEETIVDTVLLNRKLGPNTPVVQIFYPYKGTWLGDYCYDNDLVDPVKIQNLAYERIESVLRFTDDFNAKLKLYRDQWFNIIEGVEQSGEFERVSIDVDQLEPFGEHGYTFMLPLEADKGNSIAKRFHSQYAVFENETVLSPAHQHPILIGEAGNGAFSHWENLLHFSTSDNTDPRSNGRRYTLRRVKLPSI